MFSLIVIIFIGLVIRLLLVGNTGFVADISFWKSWGLAAINHGVVWTSFNTNINYPPGFIYILYLMGKIYTFLGGTLDYNSFWRENNFLFLFASKSIGIIADIIVAVLIYWFISQKEKLSQLGANINNWKLKIGNWKLPLPLLLSSIFFLNPVVILDSAQWGQVESYGIFFTLASSVLLFYRRPLLASFLFIIGTLMKLQNIIFIPLFFLFIFRYFGFKTTAKALGMAALAFFLINLPFLLQGKMERVLFLMTVNNDYFPWLSLNAHNLWWIVAKAKGMQTSDKITFLGILNAKTVGLILFSSCYLVLFLLVYIKPSARNFVLSLTLAIYSFFLFTTESHERYSYPVLVLLLFFYPFIAEKKAKSSLSPRQIFWLLYFLLTAGIFFNIHTGLIYNYPQNGIGFLTRIATPTVSIVNSYFLIFLFFPLLAYVFSQISILYLLPSVLLIIASFLGLHFSYLVKGRVFLTSFKPVIVRQDYASLQKNKSVNSFSGWKSWNRLSNNYFFYRKGFGTHAYSKLVFDINRKFSKFSTDYGVDTEASTDASVVFEIYGDGKKLFSSPKMGRFDFPGHVEVDITGIKYLGLEVTDAGDGINNDHADWLNPVLYK